MVDDYFTLVAVLSGVVVGFVLTTLSTWWGNRRDVESFRRLLYIDVIRVLTGFNRTIKAIGANLANEQLELDKDSETVNRLLELYSGTIESMVNINWYDIVRAQPFLFVKLSPEERKSITEIYEALSMLVAERNVAATLEALRSTISEPRNRIVAFKKQLEGQVAFIESLIKKGLDKTLLLEISATEHEKKLIMHSLSQD
jgi:hypothetical protein